MKKTLIFILMILVLMVSSCNLFLKEEYGELILSFDGTLPDGARALGPDGLPILSTTSMKIDIIREDGYTVTRELGAEEPKSLVELVPVGEKIEISVTAYNASSQWSGKTVHAVTSGQNHVRVLLNKNVSGLKSLLFTQTGDGQHGYNLTFYMDGKEINAPGSGEEYSFARDSKGRLYVRYKAGDSYLARYTSEGVYDTNKQLSSDADFLANDYTTGKMYGLSATAINKIEENLSLTPLSAPSPSVSAPFAVDNGIFTWGSIGSSVIYLWKAGMVPPGVHGSFSAQATDYKLGTNDGFAIKDIFIRNGYVFVLFAGVQSNISHGLYSLGAVLKWKIGTDPASGNPQFEGSPVVLGKSAGSPVIENGVLKNYDYSKNFYGAVKVIGFDDENLYIADDGFAAAYIAQAESPRIVENRNRIAALNIATNTVSFTEEYTAKWYNEWKEWRTPDTKTVVWKPLGAFGSAQKMMNYYQVERGDEDLSSAHPFITSSSSGVAYSDVFCYDSAGNFYVSGKDGSDEKLYRYVLKDDGSYEIDGEKGISEKPTTIAVSVSSIVADAGKTILFYYFESGSSHNIGRLAWYTDDFDHAAQLSNITLNDLGQNDTVTAMAVNKDGIFVAVKTVTDKDTHNEKYKITVKKYAHDTIGSDSGRVSVTGETSTNWKNPFPHASAADANKYVHESLNALYTLDGSLYGLTTKRIGVIIKSGGDSLFPDKSVITGKLLKIGDTAAFPANGNAVRLDNTPDLNTVDDVNASAISGTFSPYRFIAVKPKKLVIASDGYYAPSNNNDHMQQRNKVYIYDISKNIMEPGLDAKAEFSKKITSAFSW